jgi:hypothetical protein
MLRISSRKATTGAVCSPERQMSGVDTSLNTFGKEWIATRAHCTVARTE